MDKKVVDISNIGKLSDMDYFRPAAIHYQTFGCYTKITPNPHPNSEYVKYWKEEARRCLYGYVREYDGEWIPGYYYFYLNYSPIWLTVDRKDSKTSSGKKQADRVYTFPRIWDGDYIFFHYVEQAENNGNHGVCLKTRGRGYSFKGGSMLARNYFIIDGSISYAIAEEKEYLIRDGLLTKAWNVLDWVDNNTPWMKQREFANTPMEKRASYKDPVNGTECGTKSAIMGVSLKNDPDKAIGKRGKLILWEESGKNRYLKEAWQKARPSLEQGNSVFGYMLAFGTGGTEGANFEGLESLFYEPNAYNIYPTKNIWDEGRYGSKCGLFVPEYLNREGCYDENGNSNIPKALEEIELERENIRKTSNDPQTILLEKSQRPNTPQEAILRTEGTIFPVEDLKNHLAEVETHPLKYTEPNWKTNLVINGEGQIEWKHSNDDPIRIYPLKDTKNVRGCIEIFEQPVKNSEGNIPFGIYIAGCLPPGEKVLTDKGLKDIEKVDSNDTLFDITGKVTEIKEFTKYYVEDYDLYTIKVSNTYRTTTFTDEHPIYASVPKIKYVSSKKAQRLGLRQRYKDFNFGFVESKNITTNHWVKVPNIYKEVSDIDVSSLWLDTGRKDRLILNPMYEPDFWWFVGLFIGDGWTENNGHTVSICFNKNDKHFIDKAVNIVKKLFKRSPSLSERPGAVCLDFSFLELKQFLDKYIGKRALTKKLPEWVKRLPHHLKKELISGYLASDGCVTKDKKYYTTEFVSINLELLEGIQDILFSLGVISGITKLRGAETVKICGVETNQKEAFHLRLNTYDTLELLKLIPDNAKLSKIPKSYIENGSKRYNKNCFFDEDLKYYYLKVTEITKRKYDGYVYNFHTNDNTYMCHHLPTHNTDPYDDDGIIGSLGSTFVMNTLTGRIVAEYTGRPNTAEEYYENVWRLLKYYNAVNNYENNKKGLFSYFDKKNSLYMLCGTPKILADMEIARIQTTGNKSLGTNTNKETNFWGRQLIKTWLVSQAYGKEEGIMNLHTIKSPALLRELIAWNPESNFDRISALGMLMILKEDRTKLRVDMERQHKPKALDPFFIRNRSNMAIDMQKKLVSDFDKLSIVKKN